MRFKKGNLKVNKIRWRKQIFVNLYLLAVRLEAKLKRAGCAFSEDGYPITPREMLITDIPDDIEMYPLSKRHQATRPKCTILCAYENDHELYRFLRHFDRNLRDCLNYYGVCGFDLSPRGGMDLSHQRFHLYLNALINAYMAVNGIRVLPNWRIGDLSTLDILKIYPRNTTFSVGSLGCAKRYTTINEVILRTKLMYTCPKMLVYYGALRKEYRMIIEEFGVPVKIIMDYRTRSYLKSNQRRNCYV